MFLIPIFAHYYQPEYDPEPDEQAMFRKRILVGLALMVVLTIIGMLIPPP